MQKRPAKLDLNQLAARIVQEATGEATPLKKDLKKQAAGKKGGQARMSTLTPEQKAELSRKATEARTAKEALASKKASAKHHQLNKVN